jgi:hypothetical protein
MVGLGIREKAPDFSEPPNLRTYIRAAELLDPAGADVGMP